MCSYPTKPSRYATSPASCSAVFGPLKYSSSTAATGLTEEEISLTTAFSKADAGAPLLDNCLSTNTIFTLTESGVGVTVGEAVADGVNEFVTVGAWVAVDVAVNVGEGVHDGATDGVNV
jgi:hypothetical protein